MATRGRKPKPTAMKELEGNPGKHPLNTSEPKPNKKAPACPKWLEPEAKKEWRRLAKQMEAMRTRRTVPRRMSSRPPLPSIYKDLRQLEKSVGENDEDNSNLDLFSLEMFEDLAWLMARHADPANVPDSPEEFLDQFNTFSIYQILPQLIELWGLNVQTEVESRKNLAKVSGK